MTLISSSSSSLSALEIVRDLNNSESRRSKFTEMALQKILDSHLSAKYSYLGQLGEQRWSDLSLLIECE
jgi:hypothetical protein